MRRSSLQHHGGGVVVLLVVVHMLVYSWVMAGVWSRSHVVTGRMLSQSHVTKLGVYGVRLGVDVIGRLLLRRGRDWLLWGFPLLRIPARSV